MPRLNWTPSNNSVLCEKHFEESCFKTERNDIKNDRRKQRKGELQRKELKDDAVPTIWPNCPNHLSKTAPLPRTKLTSSSLRSQLDTDREWERLRKEDERDTFHSLEELDCKLDMVKIENIDFISKENQRIFIDLSTNQGNPVVNYALVIEMSLEFNLWCNGVNINTAILKDPNLSGISCIKSCLLINRYLEFLESTYNESKTSFEDNLKVTIDYIVEQLQTINGSKCKIEFLTEQLSLVCKKPKGRRFSNSLLAMAVMWHDISPAAYKQIMSEGLLTLPSERHLRNLTSALNADLELADSSIEYLKIKKSKLPDKDLTVAVLMDELYCQKKVQYLNGQFYGFENNNVTKTILCTMIKSVVAGKYRDVISVSH